MNLEHLRKKLPINNKQTINSEREEQAETKKVKKDDKNKSLDNKVIELETLLTSKDITINDI